LRRRAHPGDHCPLEIAEGPSIVPLKERAGSLVGRRILRVEGNVPIAKERLAAPADSWRAQSRQALSPVTAAPAAVAGHWLRSDTPSRAVPSLLAAAKRSRSASWAAEAHRRYAHAARLLQRAGDRGCDQSARSAPGAG
jgi:hypothetical protein